MDKFAIEGYLKYKNFLIHRITLLEEGRNIYLDRNSIISADK